MIQFINNFFKLKEKESNIRTEVIAGSTTFLTMVYIIPLNGIIMSKAGMPIEAVITATALITMIATILNGLWANTPIAMSVGLGLNSYFTFTLVLNDKLPWQTVLGIVFISGAFFLLLTLTKARKLIIESITPEFKIAISAGIGFFIAFIGLKEMGIIVNNPVTFVSIGNFGDKKVLLGVIGIFVVTSLVVWKIKGAFILSILITALVGFVMGIGNVPIHFISLPASISPIFLKLDIPSAFKATLIAPIITFMLTDLFDSLGTLAGVGFRAGVFEDKDSIPIQKTLEADATATVLGSLLGVSTTTSFIESASGIEEGGRSGLTAVVTGLLFSSTLLFLPFFKGIPANAIYPVLVIIGVLMFSDIKKINFSDMEIGIPAFLIIALMPLTFSITKGLSAGFITFVFIKLIRGKYKELNPIIIILAIISLLPFILKG